MVKAFIHIIVSFSVLFSSGGFWINSHFCHYEFVKTNFLFSPESCANEEVRSFCPDKEERCSKEDQEEDKDCCQNRSTYYKLDQYQQIRAAEMEDAERVTTLHAVVLPCHVGLSSLDKLTFPFLHYTPPLIIYDRQVRLQTFLC